MVKVGLGTERWTPRPRAIPRAMTDLPAPRSPVSSMKAGAVSLDASFAARASESARAVVVICNFMTKFVTSVSYDKDCSPDNQPPPNLGWQDRRCSCRDRGEGGGQGGFGGTGLGRFGSFGRGWG